MTPATHNFTVVRGTSAYAREFSPFVFRFARGGDPIPFEDVRLSVYAKKSDELKGRFLFRTSILEGGLVVTDEYSQEISWFATAEETRLLVVGLNYYEVELRDGANEVVLLVGTITGEGGLNDDETAS